MCKKDYGGNPSKYICKNNTYLKSIVDDSVIVCDEIINVAYSVLTNVTNTISADGTSTVSKILTTKK